MKAEEYVCGYEGVVGAGGTLLQILGAAAIIVVFAEGWSRLMRRR